MPPSSYFKKFLSKRWAQICSRSSSLVRKVRFGISGKCRTGPNRTGYRTGSVSPVSPVRFGRPLVGTNILKSQMSLFYKIIKIFISTMSWLPYLLISTLYENLLHTTLQANNIYIDKLDRSESFITFSKYSCKFGPVFLVLLVWKWWVWEWQVYFKIKNV